LYGYDTEGQHVDEKSNRGKRESLGATVWEQEGKDVTFWLWLSGWLESGGNSPNQLDKGAEELKRMIWSQVGKGKAFLLLVGCGYHQWGQYLLPIPECPLTKWH